MEPNETRALFVISVAAELAGMHPQTLRIYERKGLIAPARTSGRSRRYSERDIDRLRRIQELSNEGVGLAGVERILELEAKLAAALHQIESLEHEVLVTHREAAEAVHVAHTTYHGQLVPLPAMAVVLATPRPRPRR